MTVTAKDSQDLSFEVILKQLATLEERVMRLDRHVKAVEKLTGAAEKKSEMKERPTPPGVVPQLQMFISSITDRVAGIDGNLLANLRMLLPEHYKEVEAKT